MEIDDYKQKLTEKQEVALLRHCKKYDIKPVICAWYDDREDFYLDWVHQIGMSVEDAREKLNAASNNGEFKVFSDGQIVRLVL